MGEGMAACLLKAGRSLVVWNRDASKADALRAAYPELVTVAASAGDVVASCAVTYSMLSTLEARAAASRRSDAAERSRSCANPMRPAHGRGCHVEIRWRRVGTGDTASAATRRHRCARGDAATPRRVRGDGRASPGRGGDDVNGSWAEAAYSRYYVPHGRSMSWPRR